MATSDPSAPRDVVALLEDARASVEIAVALYHGATELSEREAFEGMGTLEVGYCVALHEALDRAGAPVSSRASGAALPILNIERYDERLSAFADHQMRIAEAIPSLASAAPDDGLRALLREIEDGHLRSAAWCRRHATAIAATRLMVFHGESDPVLGDVPSSTNGAHPFAAPEA